MSRRCPAAAYLSSMSGQSSTVNTDDLEPTRSMDHKKAFLRDMVDFMYRCHGYVKKAKEGHPGKEFKLCDNEKKDYLQELLSIIAQREKESKAIQKSIPDTGQVRSKIRFDPRGKSSPVSSYTGQTQLTGSPVSPISNLMGSREYQTPPRVYKSSQESTGFSSMCAQLQYGLNSSSASTDAGSPDIVSRRPPPPSANRICGLPGQDLSSSYPSYSSYPCPYKPRSYMASYNSSRGHPSVNSQYAASPAYCYQRPYAAASMPQNATAQTSFYEYARGGEPVEYYEEADEVDMNSAFLAEDEYVTEYEEDDVQDVDYGSYASQSGIVRCACK